MQLVKAIFVTYTSFFISLKVKFEGFGIQFHFLLKLFLWMKCFLNGIKNLGFACTSNLAFITTISYSYDLWMFKGGVDTFALMINFINES